MSSVEKDGEKKTHVLHKACMHEGGKQGPCLGVWGQGGRSQWLGLHQTGCNCEVDVRRQTEMHVWLQARFEGGSVCVCGGWGYWFRDSQNHLFVPRPTCGCPSLGRPSHPAPRVWSLAVRGSMRQKWDFSFTFFVHFIYKRIRLMWAVQIK